VQGENWGHPEGHILLEWELLYDNIFIFMDNDNPGIEGANRLANKFAYKKPSIFYIDPKYGIKDIDQFRVEYGYEDTVEFLINNL
jgi:DNA primase